MYMNDFEVVSGPNTGDPLGLVSEYTLNLGGTLFFPLSDGGLYLRGDYLYMSDHEPANKDDDIAIQNRKLVNARVGWRNDKWNVALWGKNLTDEAYAGFTSRLQQFSGSRAFFLQPPRTYGVEVRLNF
jgi:iron complex outermembrane receptor protein